MDSSKLPSFSYTKQKQGNVITVTFNATTDGTVSEPSDHFGNNILPTILSEISADPGLAGYVFDPTTKKTKVTTSEAVEDGKYSGQIISSLRFVKPAPKPTPPSSPTLATRLARPGALTPKPAALPGPSAPTPAATPAPAAPPATGATPQG